MSPPPIAREPSVAGRPQPHERAQAFETRGRPQLLGVVAGTERRDALWQGAPRHLLLIHAAQGQGGEDLNPDCVEAAGEPKEIRRVEEGRHAGALSADPDEYERRAVGFFDRALGVSRR